MDCPSEISQLRLRTGPRPLALPYVVPQFRRPRLVAIRHPAHQDDGPLLLLPSHDINGAGAFGIHHGVALTACAIVANNAFDGFFTETRDSERVQAQYNDILTKEEYWFHVPQPSGHVEPQYNAYGYPLVASFEHWRFPHLQFQDERHQLLRLWRHSGQQTPSELPWLSSASQISLSVHNRDQDTCRVSGYRSGCHAAHLVPNKCEAWFTSNHMRQYATPEIPLDIDAAENRILLRRDIHFAFDTGAMAITPKWNCFVLTFLKASPHLASDHHNQELYDITAVAPAFLLARFAWAVIPLLMPFLRNGGRRRVVECNNDTMTLEERTLTHQQCLQLFQIPGARSKSSSRTKRSRTETSRGDCEGHEMEKEEEEEEDRGRKRRRIEDYVAETQPYSGTPPEVTPELWNSQSTESVGDISAGAIWRTTTADSRR